MEDSLTKLKEIGAQQIHKDTHISRESVQAIIHGSFDGLNSVQLTGFISILEREYGVDLTELKLKAKEYFAEINGKVLEEHKIFVVPKKKKSNAQIYIWLAIAVFLSVAYYSFVYVSSISNTEREIDNSHIEDARKSIAKKSDEIEANEDFMVEETNETEVYENAALKVENIDTNISDVEEQKIEVDEEAQEQAELRTLKILPKNKVWAGYIDIKTNQKYQKIFREEFAIDVERDWLLLFGSGTVHLEVNGKKESFSSNQNMRFKYVDGVFTKIDITEFKSLNKGRKW